VVKSLRLCVSAVKNLLENHDSDQELINFAAQVVEKFGGIAEQHDDHLMAVLPKDLAHSLDLSEEVQLGGDDVPLLYGSPVLDRLIQLATEEVPLMLGRIEVPYLKKGGFDQQLSQDFVFTNARVDVTGRAEARTTYMVVTCKYVALSDERKEGLVEVGVHENSGAIIEDFENLWQKHHPEFYMRKNIPPHFPTHFEQAVSNAMQGARIRAEEHLIDFTNSMKRRLRRDVKNTKEYYEALKDEMEASLSNPNLGETQKQERTAKIQDLPSEMERKIEDLKHKYTIKTTLRGCAVLRFLVDVAKVMVEIRHKKFRRTEHLIWNPVSGRFDPLACELCYKTIRNIHFYPEKSEIKLVCRACSQKK